jgi:hypothetical protein
MAGSKKIGPNVSREWKHWRMNPSHYEAICKLLEANHTTRPDDYTDFVKFAEGWPKGEVKQIFREHGLDPDINWKAVVAAFRKSFEDGDHGRPKGSSAKVIIRIEKLERNPWDSLGLSASTYKRILATGTATKKQIEKITKSKARVTLEDLGLPLDFLSK